VTSSERYTTMCQELRSIVDDVGGVLLTLPASPAEVFRLSLLADHLREKISNYKNGKRILGRVETRNDEWKEDLDARASETIEQRRQATLAAMEEATRGMSIIEKESYLKNLPHSDRQLR